MALADNSQAAVRMKVCKQRDYANLLQLYYICVQNVATYIEHMQLYTMHFANVVPN